MFGPYRFVLPFAKQYWKQYLVGLLAAPLSASAALGIAKATGQAADALRRGDQEALFAATGERPLASWLPSFGLVWDLLILAIVAGIGLFSVRLFIITASRQVERDLRNKLFSHLQWLDQSFYTSAKTGDLMSRVTADVERTRLLAGPIILYASRTGFILLIGIPLMLSVSWKLTVMVMLPLSFMTIAVRIIGPRVHRETLKAQEVLGQISTLGQEDFSGIRVIKAFTQENAEKQRLGHLADDYFQQNMRVVSVSAWMGPLIGAVNDLALVSLLFIGGGLIVERSLSYGEFIEFAAYQGILIWPMLSIGWVVNQYQRARASVQRLTELLDAKPKVSDSQLESKSSPQVEARTDNSLRIQGLSFSYGDRQVLQDINLEAQAGGTIAIIGRTGSGKSTLVNLIPRLLPTPESTVFLGDVDVGRIPLKELRGLIALVPQESFLFSQTVRENIAFGREEIDESEIRQAAQVSRLDKDIDQFPDGYDEMVGERGVTLSGGQKQRAALARALIMRPQFLILDDAFSAVDTQTEEEILRRLDETSENMTTIIIAHRVSSVAHADRIYVLEDGRIAESGSHADLVKHGGIYSDLYKLQRLHDELDSF